MEAENLKDRRNYSVNEKQLYRKPESNNVPILLAIVVLQIVILVILVSALGSGIFETSGGYSVIIKGVFVLVLGAIDYLIIRRLLYSLNEADSKKSKAASEPSLSHKRHFKDKSNEVHINSESELFKNIEKQPLRSKFHDNTEEIGNVTEDTIPLDAANEKFPYLEPVSNESENRILIDKSGFVIGRLEGQVDYLLNNNAIGRIHAEFIERDGVHYIKDLNTRNGIYINDLKIDSNIDYEIRNRDRIALANIEFTFFTV